MLSRGDEGTGRRQGSGKRVARDARRSLAAEFERLQMESSEFF